jgi:hypothetical protein
MQAQPYMSAVVSTVEDARLFVPIQAPKLKPPKYHITKQMLPTTKHYDKKSARWGGLTSLPPTMGTNTIITVVPNAMM